MTTKPGEKGHRHECGCVDGHYWCSRHDIHRLQRSDDLPPHGSRRGRGTGTANPPSAFFRWPCGCFQTARGIRHPCEKHNPYPNFHLEDGDEGNRGPDQCSCHICAPCSVCENADCDDEDE